MWYGWVVLVSLVQWTAGLKLPVLQHEYGWSPEASTSCLGGECLLLPSTPGRRPFSSFIPLHTFHFFHSFLSYNSFFQLTFCHLKSHLFITPPRFPFYPSLIGNTISFNPSALNLYKLILLLDLKYYCIVHTLRCILYFIFCVYFSYTLGLQQ